jgi:hypothetical protein
MKKIYAFLAAALMSVSVFASKDVVPSDQVLAEYYQPGQVCVCFFVPADMACYDIVMTGSFIGWSDDLSKCIACEAVEGYDGWYVAAFKPEDEPDAEKGIQAKPIMKSGDGAFSWDYQVGAATVIRGGVQVVAGGVAGEIDLINYGTDAPNVFTVDSWKKNPCTAVYHNYRIEVISDGCDGYVIPFICGSFTDNWKIKQMQVDVARTQANGAPTYTYTAKAAEGAEYGILSAGTAVVDGKLVITDSAAWKDDSYIQQLVGEEWIRIYNGANFVTGEKAEIVWDLRDDTLRWARCDGQVAERVVVYLNAPANGPEKIEIIGSFDGWTGAEMELLDNGWYLHNEVMAKPNAEFKFRSAIGENSDAKWAVQIEYYDAENDEWKTFGDNGGKKLIFKELWEEGTWKGEKVKSIELDFSDPEAYRWTGAEQGIENVVLTEKAHKVVVDGVIYIVRDNKMFNLQGVQVR